MVLLVMRPRSRLKSFTIRCNVSVAGKDGIHRYGCIPCNIPLGLYACVAYFELLGTDMVLHMENLKCQVTIIEKCDIFLNASVAQTT